MKTLKLEFLKGDGELYKILSKLKQRHKMVNLNVERELKKRLIREKTMKKVVLSRG